MLHCLVAPIAGQQSYEWVRGGRKEVFPGREEAGSGQGGSVVEEGVGGTGRA